MTQLNSTEIINIIQEAKKMSLFEENAARFGFDELMKFLREDIIGVVGALIYVDQIEHPDKNKSILEQIRNLDRSFSEKH